MPTITGVNYRKVIATGVLLNDTYDLVPFYAGGQAQEFLIVEADTTLGVIVINLPDIANFNSVYNTSIKIIGLTGATNDVTINTTGGNFIGSLSTTSLTTDNSNIVLNAVGAENWSAVISA
jgi:hypothetical protein